MAGPKLPWMPFFGDDFFGDRHVQVMALETQAIYLQFLWFSWREGGLPKDLEDLANIARMSKIQFKKHWAKIAPCWKDHPDNTTQLVNPRLEAVRQEQRKTASKKSDAGRKAADRRWGKERADA